MRIPDDSLPAVQAIHRALFEAYDLGKRSTPASRFAGGIACADLLKELDSAGFVIALKAAARPGKPIEIKLPDGSLIHGYFDGGEAPKVGTVSLLTPEAQRIIQSVREGVRADIGKLFVGFTERPITPEDFTGPVTLEPGTLTELPEGYTAKAAAAPPPASIAQAIRDCFEASRLAYEAAGVIGHDAVSEILNSAEPPATDAGEAA
ncbi:hypothetical protein ACLBXO_16310 [Methylobacterium sp. C33D]